jgi:hypothetical protein
MLDALELPRTIANRAALGAIVVGMDGRRMGPEGDGP